MLKKELQAFLEANGIPLNEWGKGSAKTIDHLLAELNAEESVLEKRGDKLVRLTYGGAVNVYYRGQSLLVLREEKQVYKDGRERRRRHAVASVAEKIRQGEDSIHAAYRALSEELGIHDALSLVFKPKLVHGPVPSGSFPGIYSVHTLHMHDVYLPQHLYRSEGYVEQQEDKTSYFVWTHCSDPGARA